MQKLEINQRRYLGSKTKLIPLLKKILNEKHIKGQSILDLFAGTGVVGHSFNSMDNSIITNDILYSNYLAHVAFLGNASININKLSNLIISWNELESIELKENYFSNNFADTYFSHENCLKIGYIRESIEEMYKKNFINLREKAYLVTSLIYSADRIANTVGHYDAYRKVSEDLDRKLIISPLKIEEHEKNQLNKQYHLDANELVRLIDSDIVYIDPPYNSRQYSDTYHLLENIAEWKKPDVLGVAKKMDRKKIKSKYSGKNATDSFSDLITNINAKYIIVSYNDMGKSGNTRSHGLIDDYHLLSALKLKGQVSIYIKEFNQFAATSKKSKPDLKERFFICEVGNQHIGEVVTFNLDNKEDNKKIDVTNQNLVKSPLNYTGGKYRLLPQILPLIPSNINCFYDVFTGGANVGVNVIANEIKCIDINDKVINLLHFIRSLNIDDLHHRIIEKINYYNLSLTYQNGYKYYGVDSSKGLSSVNKQSYKQLKEDYNLMEDSEEKNLVFLLLIIYGFNNQIRFNRKEEFNMPVGKRDYNGNVQKNLRAFNKVISNKNIEFISGSFHTLLDLPLSNNDFVYLDPPYLLGIASYNELDGWNMQHEIELISTLEIIDKKNIPFALSNVLIHKGENNDVLMEAINKNNWKIHFLNYNYNNSNYHSTAKQSITKEVLITNY